MNVPGKGRTQPHTLQCHITGYIDTDPFKPTLSPPTAKKKRCVHTCTILNLFGTTSSWESESPGFSDCKVTSPGPSADPDHPPEWSWAPAPWQPPGHTPSWPSWQPCGSCSLHLSTTQTLLQLWELKHPIIIPSCWSRVGLSPLCKSLTVYKSCFHWPRSCSSRVGVQGNNSRLHSAHICSQGSPDMDVYKRDWITQVIIILHKRLTWIYCSGVSHFSYRSWKMFLQTKLQNTELLAKVCVIYNLIKM